MECSINIWNSMSGLDGIIPGFYTGRVDGNQRSITKILFAADELTGIVGAAALMRPSKSVSDMELKSLKKKFKDKKFAAGCSRDVIRQGAENLGWELDYLLNETLEAMKWLEENK